MAWTKGFNFRSSSGFVTDGTDETYVIGTGVGPTDNYPTTRNSVTFGWTNTFGSVPQDRDRNSGIDRRLAGCHFWDAGGAAFPGLFRVDLTATGDYVIRLAAGDAYGARSTGFVEIRDNATAQVTIDHASGYTSAANYRDAVDAEYSAANWPGSNTSTTKTFSTTTLIIAVGKYGAGQDGWLAHLFLDQVATTTAHLLPLLGVGA